MDSLQIQPVITEKTMRMVSENWFTFKIIGTKITKNRIASVIAKLYKVDVVNVRTLQMHGKIKRRGKKLNSRKESNWQKVYIKLKQGQTIGLFSSAGEEPAK